MSKEKTQRNQLVIRLFKQKYQPYQIEDILVELGFQKISRGRICQLRTLYSEKYGSKNKK
jgi:hypothetical protein